MIVDMCDRVFKETHNYKIRFQDINEHPEVIIYPKFIKSEFGVSTFDISYNSKGFAIFINIDEFPKDGIDYLRKIVDACFDRINGSILTFEINFIDSLPDQVEIVKDILTPATTLDIVESRSIAGKNISEVKLAAVAVDHLFH